MDYSRMSFGPAGALIVALIGWGLILGVLTVSACSRAPEDPAPPRPVAVTEPETLPEKIQNVDSLFELHTLREEYLGREEETDPAVVAALNERRDRLVEEADAFPAIPGKLDFLGWNIEWAGPDPDRRPDDDRESYRISGYFVVTGEIDRDWIFRVITKVDDRHVPHLPPDRRNARYLNWGAFTNSSAWSPGEHHVLTAVAELKPVPWYIYGRMFYPPELLNHANFTYGWFADPDVGPIPEDKPAPR